MTHLRVLMVEDSEDDAELIRLDLERAGFEIEWRRVETEPDYLAALDEPWDIVISDFRMPEFDGLRAFALYQQRGVDIPFLFVSGVLGEDRAVEAMRAGARDYLLKGNLGRLGVTVKRELAEAQNRRDQREAQESARREQRRLAMAVEASGAGIFEYRIPLGPDTYHSERWAQILGYALDELPPREAIAEWAMDQIHPDDRPLVERSYEAFVTGRSKGHQVEFRIAHKDGHWVDVMIRSKAIQRDDKNRATHVVGVLLDVTERRRLEAQLRGAQKMEAIGRLAGGVAHDFNNILTAMEGFGSYVLEALRESDPARDDMQELLKCVRRAETLTNQLLAFSRRQPVSPRVFNINDLVADLDKMLRRVVGEDVDLSTVLAPDLAQIRMDSGSLEQVIVNLAVNARDAMPDGGKLVIETENETENENENEQLDEDDGKDHGAEVPPGRYVVVSISDTGIGIDEVTRQSIFEPFFTTKERGKGTGLGLSTCYGIVKQAGGYIWVYSEPGMGTTFKIYLPQVEQQADPVLNVDEPKDLRGSETILVVEDDDPVRRVAARVLSSLGYRVIEAASGHEALKAFQNPADAINLLLTDMVMPEMSGKQLSILARTLQPELKVLYTSGYTANTIVHRGDLEPGTHILHKPFTPSSLAKKTREVLDG